MPRIDPKYRVLFWFVAWPIMLSIQIGARSDFRDFLKASFWLDLGVRILLWFAVVSVGVGCFYAYACFCGWFNRTIEGERTKITARIASRDGNFTWSASHPLHDSEVDG